MMNEHLTSSPYLTLGEAALYARCSTRTIQRWLSDKKLCRYGHGRLVLIRKDELEALLSTSRSA
jgi:excisionase family DNA binding protein